MAMSKLTALLLAALVSLAACSNRSVQPDNADAARIDRAVDSTLQDIYRIAPETRALAKRAAGVLVFPGISRGSFLQGSDYRSDGTLRRGSRSLGHYRFSSGPLALPGDLRGFDLVLFITNPQLLGVLTADERVEIGVGFPLPTWEIPALGVADESMGHTSVYSVALDGTRRLDGIELRGSRIARIDPKPE